MMSRRVTLSSLLALVLLAGGAQAQNQIKAFHEGAIIFRNTGQTPTASAVMTLSSLQPGTAQVSAQFNRGTGTGANNARTPTLCWVCTFALNGAGTPGQTLELYIARSNGTQQDGPVGTANVTLNATVVPAVYTMAPLGVFVVNNETSTAPMTGWGCSEALIPHQYISLVVVNRTSLATVATASANRCDVLPTPLEVEPAS